MKPTFLFACSLLLAVAMVVYGQVDFCADPYTAPNTTAYEDCAQTTINDQLCFDQCTGDLVSAENCSRYNYCCEIPQGNSSVCRERRRLNIVVTAVVAPENTITNPFATSGGDDEEEGDGSRNFVIGGGNPVLPPGGGFNPFFPPPQALPYPQNCQNYQTPNPFEPPIDIPYCKRIACDPNNPGLDSDRTACLQTPGCYFDQELFLYRENVGLGILPGVPVCQLVIRNRAFQQRAKALMPLVPTLQGVWNPFFTRCVLTQFQDEIAGPHCDCDKIDLLEYFGYYPKLAGWTGISRDHCAFIGGCWRVKAGQAPYCAYPVNNQGQPTIRSDNEQRLTGPTPSPFLFGLPECYRFPSSPTSSEFLSSYDACLRAGCASSVSENTLFQHLLSLGSGLNPYSQGIYQSLVLSGQVRADNYQKYLDSMQGQRANVFGFFQSPQPSRVCESNPFSTFYFGISNPFSQIPQIPQIPQVFPPNLFGSSSFPSSGSTNPNPFGTNFNPNFNSQQNTNPPILPNSFNFGNQGNIPNFGNQGNIPNFGNQGSIPNFGNQGSFPNFGNPSPNTGNNFNTFPNTPFNPFFPQQSNPCPYAKPPRLTVRPPNQYNPFFSQPQFSTVELLGSFEGCCELPLCYIPKADLYTPVSGVSPYLTQWNCWSVCSRSCGGGLQNRTRTCAGQGCSSSSSLVQQRTCGTSPCGAWSQWGVWDVCSRECGSGTQTRSRSCDGGSNCGDDGSEQRSCNTQACPVYSPIAIWDQGCIIASGSCGTGFQYGTRVCTRNCGPSNQGLQVQRRCEIVCNSFSG